MVQIIALGGDAEFELGIGIVVVGIRVDLEFVDVGSDVVAFGVAC